MMESSKRPLMDRFSVTLAVSQSLSVLVDVAWGIKIMRCICGGKMEIMIHDNRPPTFVCLTPSCSEERPIGGSDVIQASLQED